MQKSLSFFCLTAMITCFISSTVQAQDRVIVVPMGGTNSPNPKDQGVAELTCPGHSVPIGIDDTWNVICSIKTVFVSSEIYSGNLGGLAGADAKCNALASAAGLKGTYMAWLSDSTRSPATRFNDYEYNNYALTDGTSIAYSWADLIDSSLLHAINLDEDGQATSSSHVWTNTWQDGTAANFSCADWTSSDAENLGGRGTTYLTNLLWTNNGAPFCNAAQYPIYCFEQ